MPNLTSHPISTRRLAALAAGLLWSASGLGQTASQPAADAAGAAGSSAIRRAVRPAPSNSPFVRHMRADETQHAMDFYENRWGVDSLDVKRAESGQMIRFSYRILDPVRAAALNDKAAKPYLLDETSHVRLEIPSMENVGQLRQSGKPEAGKAYWMVFSNKGAVVKPGDRVDVVIGKFQANGLSVR